MADTLLTVVETAAYLAKAEKLMGEDERSSIVDVLAIRHRFGLSRAKFAARFGLPPRALQDLE